MPGDVYIGHVVIGHVVIQYLSTVHNDDSSSQCNGHKQESIMRVC